jgi:hypothetical protein
MSRSLKYGLARQSSRTVHREVVRVQADIGAVSALPRAPNVFPVCPFFLLLFQLHSTQHVEMGFSGSDNDNVSKMLCLVCQKRTVGPSLGCLPVAKILTSSLVPVRNARTNLRSVIICILSSQNNGSRNSSTYISMRWVFHNLAIHMIALRTQRPCWSCTHDPNPKAPEPCFVTPGTSGSFLIKGYSRVA